MNEKRKAKTRRVKYKNRSLAALGMTVVACCCARDEGGGMVNSN